MSLKLFAIAPNKQNRNKITGKNVKLPQKGQEVSQ